MIIEWISLMSTTPLKATDQSTTDISLLRRVGEYPFDTEAWVELVQRYSNKIYSWATYWGLQDADARDLMQQVLLQLTRVMRSFKYDPSKSFRAWLKTLTHRAWRDICRKRTEKAGESSAVEDLFHSQEARQDFEARMEEAYDLEIFELAMIRVKSRVHPQTWEAFRLMSLEGQRASEVANQLDMKLANVYKASSNVMGMIKEEAQSLEADCSMTK